MTDVHELAAFYALGALDGDDLDRFERHLPDCAECRAELASYGPGVDALARDIAEPAPAVMRAAVMASIGEPLDAEREGSASVRIPTEASHVVVPMRRPVWSVVATISSVAAISLAIVAFGAYAQIADLREVNSVFTASDVEAVEIETETVGSIRVAYSEDLGRGVMTAAGVPAVGADETYQMWLIGEAGPVSAGLFRPEDDGSIVVLLEGGVDDSLVFGLTVEPDGGSEQPTGEILALGEL